MDHAGRRSPAVDHRRRRALVPLRTVAAYSRSQSPSWLAWLGDPLSGSWASVIPGDTKDRYEVRQRGPRRLWQEVEAAYRWWLDQGKPTLDQWRFTVSPDRQTADLH